MKNMHVSKSKAVLKVKKKRKWIKRETLEAKIRYLRKDMQRLIEQKDNLLDQEVIKISQELDIVLNQYYIYLINKGFKGA